MRVAAILVVLSVAAGAGESPTPPALEEFREALAQVIAYEHGQECEGLYQLDELVREGLNGPGASEGMERLLLEALESRDAAVACKQFVCKQLSVVGGKASVPVLAKLLDEGTVWRSGTVCAAPYPWGSRGTPRSSKRSAAPKAPRGWASSTPWANAA